MYFSTHINDLYIQHKSTIEEKIGQINFFGESAPYNLESLLLNKDKLDIIHHHHHHQNDFNMDEVYRGLIEFYKKFGDEKENTRREFP